jgi:hypothetical protein
MAADRSAVSSGSFFLFFSPHPLPFVHAGQRGLPLQGIIRISFAVLPAGPSPLFPRDTDGNIGAPAFHAKLTRNCRYRMLRTMPKNFYKRESVRLFILFIGKNLDFGFLI